MKLPGVRRAIAAAVVAASLLAPAAPVSAETLVALTQIGRLQALVEIDSDSPFVPTNFQLITGLDRRQALVALDVRPVNGQLFAVGVNGRDAQLYRLNLGTGKATSIGPAFRNLDHSNITVYGFDFNPTIDRARLVSSAGQNIVFNPDTGVATEATDLFYAAADPNAGQVPTVSANAYDNNVGGALSSVQRVIDTRLNILATLANNAGTLTTIGSLGVDPVAVSGFDVSGTSGIAYAIMTPNQVQIQQLFTINLVSGQATLIGTPALGILPIVSISTLPPAN